MKKITLLLIIILSLSGCLVLTSCIEYVAGVGTGIGLAQTAQADLIKAVDSLDAKTLEINNELERVEGLLVITPKEVEAIQSLKGREKDPVTWIAMVSILINVFAGGRIFTNRKRT